MSKMSKLLAALAVTSLLLLLTGLPTCNAQGQDLPPRLTELQAFEDICDPANFTNSPGPTIPPLPRQFSFHAEANILNKNRITWIHEFFDEIGNRGRINFFREGVREQVIFDYSNNEIFIFPNLRDDTECSVIPLAQSRFLNFSFGITRVNGSIHIGSARQFLEFLSDDTPVRFMGMNYTVRGVPALQWDACINRGNVSMLASYYYNSDDFSYPTIANTSTSNMVLSQIVVRGVSLFNGSLSNFYHVYSIFGLHSGPDSVQDRFFRVPTGMACVGRIPGISVPEAPRFFSSYFEQIDPSRNTVSVFREFYDSVHNLFRFDLYYDGRLGGEPGPYQIIHDFDSQVYYHINQHTGNCTAGSLREPNLFFQDITRDEDGTPRLTSPLRLLLLDSNFSYEGVSTVRGLEVDSWITLGDSYTLPSGTILNDYVYELFFTRPEYTHNTLLSSNSSSIPWAYNLRGTVIYTNYSDPTNTSMMEIDESGSLFGFSVNEPPYDAFDATLCFSPEETHTVLLIIEAPRVGIDFRTFRTNLRAGLVNYLSLRPLQINNIHIPFDNGTHLFVAFHVTNISLFTTPGDTETTADQAVDTLEENADQPLPFMVDLGNGQSVSPFFRSFRRGRTNFNNDSDACPTVPPPRTTTMPSTTASNCGNDNITGRLGLSDGIVAGIAIALFVVGFLAGLLAVLVCFICCKCLKGKDIEVSSVKYKKHSDEMEAI